MFTPFFFGGIEFLIPLALILLVVLIVRQGGGNDRHGHRPFAIYLFIVSFISLVTVLGAIGFIATVIGNQATNSRSFVTGEQCTASFSGSGSDLNGGQSFGPVTPVPAPQENCQPTGPSDAPVAIRAGLIALVAGGVLWFHATQARALLDKERAHA